MPSADLGFPDFYRAELAPQVRRAFLMLGDNEQANDVSLVKFSPTVE